MKNQPDAESLLQQLEILRTQPGFPETDAPEKSLQDLAEEIAFLRYLATIEKEPTSTLARQLINDGIELPSPEDLVGQQLHNKLWEVIAGLAKRRCFLESTDHLSEAELYRYLWHEALNDKTHELDDQMGPCACHLDLIGNGSEEAESIYLTYYADEQDREHFQVLYDDAPLPPRRPLPYDRDRHLPSP